MPAGARGMMPAGARGMISGMICPLEWKGFMLETKGFKMERIHVGKDSCWKVMGL